MRKIKKSIKLVVLCIVWFICGFIWGTVINNNLPTIEIEKGVIQMEQKDGIGYLITGAYYPYKNKIRVSLSSDDIANTLIHEYGHYIYRTLSKKDLDYWNNDLCNTSKRIEGYTESQICDEWFARQFAAYTLGNYDIPESEFMNKVHAYYLR